MLPRSENWWSKSVLTPAVDASRYSWLSNVLCNQRNWNWADHVESENSCLRDWMGLKLCGGFHISMLRSSLKAVWASERSNQATGCFGFMNRSASWDLEIWPLFHMASGNVWLQGTGKVNPQLETQLGTKIQPHQDAVLNCFRDS